MFNERVIKVLKPALFAKEGAKERFHREVQLTANLSEHNYHIVRIYDDFGEEPQLGPYYVMEYLRGESLGERLEEMSPLPLPMVHHIFGQLCDAMGAAHRANIVHRDLKPENIFLTQRDKDDSFVKILDFGLARPNNPEGNVTQGIFGTPAYMSPEQCQGNPVDGRTDIYSMAIILYEMLTGELPYVVPRNETMTLLVAHISQTPIPLLNHRPDLPSSLNSALLRALSKPPEERFATAEEFWDALSDGLLGRVDTQPNLRSAGHSSAVNLHGPTSANPALAADLAPATLGYGGNAVSFINEEEDEPTFVTHEPFSFDPNNPPVDPSKTLASESVPEELLREAAKQDPSLLGESTEIGTPAVLEETPSEESEYNLEELLIDDPEEAKASLLSLESEASTLASEGFLGDEDGAIIETERTVRAVNPLTQPRNNFGMKDTDPLSVKPIGPDLETKEEKLPGQRSYGPQKPTAEQMALSKAQSSSKSKPVKVKRTAQKTTKEKAKSVGRSSESKPTLFPSLQPSGGDSVSLHGPTPPSIPSGLLPDDEPTKTYNDVLVQGAQKRSNPGLWLLLFLLLAVGIFSATLYMILLR